MLRIWPICAFILIACSGCDLIPLATLGTVLGIAGTAASTGTEVYQAGKLDTAFMADRDKCRDAVLLAALDLKLHVVRDRELCKGKWDFQLQDDLKSKIEVTLQRRTEQMCRCRVNVGLFGSRPTAELIMHRIQTHLPAQSTMPAPPP
jgi:Protein of unknown function (DUF3568)